jgi:hypothetical protein
MIGCVWLEIKIDIKNTECFQSKLRPMLKKFPKSDVQVMANPTPDIKPAQTDLVP